MAGHKERQGGGKRPEFIATFTTGFGEYIQKQLGKDLKGIRVIGLYDGLIHFAYNGDSSNLKKRIYFNNLFYVLKVFRGKQISFEQMVNTVCQSREILPVTRGSFRIRFSRENQFARVDRRTAAKAEDHILKESGLKMNRVSPSTEIWYMIRREGIGFYGQLLERRRTTEKGLHKGELRPEFASLMCLCADISETDIVCDPFCGYGAIPRQLVKNFSPERVLASDLDGAKTEALKEKMSGRKNKIMCFAANILNLSLVENESVDRIVTDPPWGYYEEIEDIGQFYCDMLAVFRRILKADGRAVVLSARKQEFISACARSDFIVEKQIDTLVNGKKAAVFIARKERGTVL